MSQEYLIDLPTLQRNVNINFNNTNTINLKNNIIIL